MLAACMALGGSSGSGSGSGFGPAPALVSGKDGRGGGPVSISSWLLSRGQLLRCVKPFSVVIVKLNLVKLPGFNASWQFTTDTHLSDEIGALLQG